MAVQKLPTITIDGTTFSIPRRVMRVILNVAFNTLDKHDKNDPIVRESCAILAAIILQHGQALDN